LTASIAARIVSRMNESCDADGACGVESTAIVAGGSSWSLRSSTIGALPLLNEWFRRLRLDEFFAAYVAPGKTRARVPWSTGLLVLLRNILLSREPVYGVGEWAAQHAPSALGLTAQQVAALNDDRIGRCLDRLFDADQRSLLLAVVTHAIREFGVALDELHVDSTTISFFGDYEKARHGATTRGKATPAITYGHSKDHRPDLKQILFELTMSSDGGVPVYFEASDGNLTDDQTHRRTWDLIRKLAGRADFLYVADCKLATTENMKYIDQQGGRFISVLPRSRKEDPEFRSLLLEAAVTWRDLHERRDEEGNLLDKFRIAQAPATTREGLRLLWIHSARKQDLDAAARAEKIERTLKDLALLKKKIQSPRSRWRDATRIRQAVEKILARRGSTRWILTRVDSLEQASFRQEQRGRPGKNTRYVRSTSTRFDLFYELETVHIATDSLSDGVFPLVSNDRQLSDVEVLLAYKKQPFIERRFENLKTDFCVAPVFLKGAARVQALLCVYFLALLVEALIEREVRRRMAAANIQALPLYPERRPARAPTARRILDAFENVQRHDLASRRRQVTTLRTDLNSKQRKILRLLQLDPSSYGI
jgi:transposase